MRRWPSLLAFPVLLAAPALAGDFEHGKIISARCVACHGVNGATNNPMIPKLAGQNGDYLLHALKEFKDGKRTNPLMDPVAHALSEQEMEDVATYFANEKPAPPEVAKQ